MKLPTRTALLKILASAAKGACVYAGAVTLRTALFHSDGGLFSILFFVFIMLIGHLAGVLFLAEVPVFAGTLAAWSIILLPLSSSLMIYRGEGIWRAAFEILVVFIVYSMSLKHSKLTSTQIMSKATAYTGFIALAACLEAPYFISELSYLRPWLFAASYLFILAYLVIRNHEDIDSNIFSKKRVEKSILPKNLRRFNTALVCVVFLSILLLFNLKTIVIYSLQLLSKITVYIIAGIMWIIGKIFMPQETTQQGEAPAQKFDFFADGAENKNSLIEVIFYILAFIIILYLAYKALQYLSRKLPALIKSFIKWVKKLLSIEMSEKLPETTDYIDETVIIKPVSANAHANKNKLKKKRKGLRRDLRNIKDPVERVRQMYSSMLSMLPLIGVHPDRCDTTMDILGKASSSREAIKELLPFTEIYNGVRYGEKVPDAAMLAKAEEYFDRTADAIGKQTL